MNKELNLEKQLRLKLSFKEIERILCGQGKFEFFGCPINQIPKAVNLINHLLEIVKPIKIIEFGTGLGGLSVLLSLYSSIKGIQFLTYDATIHNQHILRHLVDTSSFRFTLLEKEEIKHEIKHTIWQAEKGPVIVFCDAMKSQEFNYYSQFLKKGDFILMHDYSRTQNCEQFKNTCEKYNWTAPQEQWYDNIAEACEKYDIVPFMHNEFEDVLWFCGVKNSDKNRVMN